MSHLTKDIEGILAVVKEYYKKKTELEEEEEENLALQEVEELPFEVPETPARPFVCVDGSFSNLVFLKELDCNISIFRVSTVEYQFGSDGHPVLKRHHVFDKIQLVSTDASFYKADPLLPEVIRIATRFEGRELDIVASMIMYVIEQKALLAAARRYHDALIVRDGTLTVFLPMLELQAMMDEILQTCVQNNNILVGISKDSSSHYLDDPLVDEAVLNNEYGPAEQNGAGPVMSIRIPPKRVKRHHKFKVYGDVYFARMHRFAEKFFRVDIGIPKDQAAMAFGEIAKYCIWEATPGFPFPLVQAHISAKAVRDVKDSYVEQIIDAWREYGIPKEVLLSGLLDKNGVAAGKFHTTIDMISKI
ncbi:MAG TPA: hypothetical protein VKK79_00155 [Candidatus Lokiarchaeia archaeon]|nr:hypothetical protein [Candidatus Lokiarchaeia archaeon]